MSLFRSSELYVALNICLSDLAVFPLETNKTEQTKKTSSVKKHLSPKTLIGDDKLPGLSRNGPLEREKGGKKRGLRMKLSALFLFITVEILYI